ncbi:MAG: nucleoside hydrolase [Spirochaetes bacterium]|nr:nucleoside hydrolase [Spirochaetota bacterium]
MKKIPVIIDTYPGIDDALALLLAFQSDVLDIKLITTTAGNVALEKTTHNALYLVEKYGYGIPVAAGAVSAIGGAMAKADDVHGVNGLGDFIIPDDITKRPIETDAVEAIKDILDAAREKITVITLGPLTNIANLIDTYPAVTDTIAVMYSMIGSFDGRGNIVPHAEFNAYCDPDAVRKVLDSGIPVIFSPMELGHQSCIAKSIFINHEVHKEKDVLIAKMIAGGFDSVTKGAFSLHDPNTIMAVTNPEYYDFPSCDIRFTDTGEYRGQFKVLLSKTGAYKVQTIRDVDAVKNCFLKEIYR